MVGKDMFYHFYKTYTYFARYKLLDRRLVLKIPVKQNMASTVLNNYYIR